MQRGHAVTLINRTEVTDILTMFLIDPHALRYFGIIRFLDRPGFFPQLTNGGGVSLSEMGIGGESPSHYVSGAMP